MQRLLNDRKFIFIFLLAALLSGLIFFFFYRLGSHPLVDWDEAIYGQVARQSWETNSQVDLHWYGSISPKNPQGLWFEKPPLIIWLIEGAYQVFGPTEFAVRVFGGIFVLGMIVMTYLLALEFFKSHEVSLLTTGLYYFAHYIFTQAWFMKFDIPVTFFILLAFWSMLKAEKNSKFYFLFWIGLGLGVMAKSVIGLLPLPMLIIWSLAGRDFSFLKKPLFYWGSLACMAIVLPWHIVESYRYGKEFWNVYLGLHIFRRYFSEIDSNHASFWYYFKQLQSNLIFFALAVLAWLYFIHKSFFSQANKKIYLALALNALFIFFFFSFSVTKLPSYIVVLYPFIIIMIAKFLFDAAALSKNKIFRTSLLTLLVLVFVVSGIFYNVSKVKNDGYYSKVYIENKFLTEFAVKNFPNLPLLVLQRDAPSVMFYANQRVRTLSPETKISKGSFILLSSVLPNYPNQTLLAHGATAQLFLVTVE